jgi:hypothetical protein
MPGCDRESQAPGLDHDGLTEALLLSYTDELHDLSVFQPQSRHAQRALSREPDPFCARTQDTLGWEITKSKCKTLQASVVSGCPFVPLASRVTFRRSSGKKGISKVSGKMEAFMFKATMSSRGNAEEKQHSCQASFWQGP